MQKCLCKTLVMKSMWIIFHFFFLKNIENQVALLSCKTVQGQKRCVQKDKQNQGPIEFVKGVFSGPKANIQVW
jgi:hypothetical protein